MVDMYKIFILDVALLNTFLAAADTDYVNAIIGKEIHIY